MDDTVTDGVDDAADADPPTSGQEAPDATPIETFGRYGLLSLLGAGGMGQVWRARDSQTNRVVALKVLPERSADDEESRERFRRECEAVAQLTEPHIIPIHDFGDVNGRLFLNMRLVDGQDLRTVIKQDGALPPARAVAIIVQVAGALQAAHDVGLVHRDVKPSNILVSENDFAYLIDFGIAHASGDATLTKAGETIGTAAYMAPEAIGAAVKAHSRVDVYALTCVLYECLTGQPPFTSDAGMQGLIAHHLHTAPPQPSVTSPGVPVSFDAVIAKGMAKNPDDRFGSVHELATAARQALTGGTPRDTEPAASPVRWSRKRWAVLAAAVLTAVAVVVAGVVVVGRSSTEVSATAPSSVGDSGQIPLPFPEIRVSGGVAVDTAGNVYVTAIGADVVMRLAAGATSATRLPITGLKNPQDVAVDAKGGVYVTDSSNDRVLWLPAGAPAAATLPFTGLNDPRGIIVSPAGDVYLVDRGNDRVLYLRAGATTATTLPFTGLNDPRGVAIDAAGGVVVTDTGNNRVLALPVGAAEARALPFTGINDPHGVAIDSTGTIYVTDRGNAGIVELRPGATAAIPLPFSGLNDPNGVAVDGAGNVYVTDVGSHPVVKLPAVR